MRTETPRAAASPRLAGAVVQLASYELLRRHVSGDWGDVSLEDARENELSIRQGFCIISSYRVSTAATIWIITESDRSATTLLLPEEY